ncbi:hypothetical protein [Acinetobacter baumannii]|uniref:hypothetical protein n=1 Tax=Acinetobacter baumannii TaxID=470 RepID=UPI00298CF7EB|nr:hypothetical protein [Acinetobacter baumannii]WNX64878.1 hypothetical protein RWV42_07360 [Acinetobacter baumannii]HCA5150970.1 hypothetical protein [Acinetobacter baumannii]
MHIILENISNGIKLKVNKAEGNEKWFDENGNQIEEKNHIKTLDEGIIGTEIGGLLYESRYRIVEVIH